MCILSTDFDWEKQCRYTDDNGGDIEDGAQDEEHHCYCQVVAW